MIYDENDFKKTAKSLKNELNKLGLDLSLGATLNLLSRSLGFKDYNTALPAIKTAKSTMNFVESKINDITSLVTQRLELEDEIEKFDKKSKGILSELLRWGYTREEGTDILTFLLKIKADSDVFLPAKDEYESTKKAKAGILFAHHVKMLRYLPQEKAEFIFKHLFFEEYIDLHSNSVDGPEIEHYIDIVESRELFDERLLDMLDITAQEFEKARSAYFESNAVKANINTKIVMRTNEQVSKTEVALESALQQLHIDLSAFTTTDASKERVVAIEINARNAIESYKSLGGQMSDTATAYQEDIIDKINFIIDFGQNASERDLENKDKFFSYIGEGLSQELSAVVTKLHALEDLANSF